MIIRCLKIDHTHPAEVKAFKAVVCNMHSIIEFFYISSGFGVGKDPVWSHHQSIWHLGHNGEIKLAFIFISDRQA